MLGARNSVFFTAFRSRNEPVEDLQAGALSPLRRDVNINNTQIGASVVWIASARPESQPCDQRQLVAHDGNTRRRRPLDQLYAADDLSRRCRR